MSAPPSLTEKLANVQHMPSLIAATVASDKPTDMYLVRDIIKMSYESVQTRVFLQKYFTNQLLTSRNVYVKIKVLQIVVCLLEEGHPDFHRNLQKTPEAFKESANIRTNDSSMAADCGRIRDLANKLLDMIYEDPPEDRQCPYGITTSSNTSNTMGGASSKGGRALGGRIQGFGTTRTTTQSSSVSDQITNAVGSLLGSAGPKPKKNLVYDEKYATMDYIPQPSSRMGGGGFGSYYGTQGSGQSHTSMGSEHVRGRPGGGWSEEEVPNNETPPTNNQNSNLEETPINNGEQESRLVDEITTPGGVRVAPPKEDLKKFLSRCKNLDCLVIVDFLRIKLQSDNTQIVTKALFVIESLLRSDIPDILSYLDITLEQLTELSTSSQNSTIKAKSTKLLHQLSAVESLSVTMDTQTKADKTGHAIVTDNLLEVDGATNEQVTEYSSLFSGLSLTNSGTIPQTLHATKPVKPVTDTSLSTLVDGSTINGTTPTSSNIHQFSVRGGGDLLDLGNHGDDNFDPLLSTGSSQNKLNDPLEGLTSLDDSTQSTTPTSTPLEPIQPLTSSSFGLDEFLIKTTPTMTSVTYPTMAPPGLLDPGISNPPGVYQYSQQQHPMMYNQVLNRPVQLMPQTHTTNPDSDITGFGFLSKSTNKAGAFDFVQEEMKAANKRS